jgi:hypothetical protein
VGDRERPLHDGEALHVEHPPAGCAVVEPEIHEVEVGLTYLVRVRLAEAKVRLGRDRQRRGVAERRDEPFEGRHSPGGRVLGTGDWRKP